MLPLQAYRLLEGARWPLLTPLPPPARSRRSGAYGRLLIDESLSTPILRELAHPVSRYLKTVK